jgi:hypothetical protein
MMRRAEGDDEGPSVMRRLWFASRLALPALAIWVAAAEPWDTDGDGRVSVHEILLFPVRFLAFPLHVLLRVTPDSVMDALDLPHAQWPSSAIVAVVLSLPLWGLVLIGGLVAQAWLEAASEARRRARLAAVARQRATTPH